MDSLIEVVVTEKVLEKYSGLHEKREYRRLFNSYVAHTKRFANRNSLGMAPPLACRALTMVKFPTKNGDDGLHCRDQFLNCSAILSTQSPLNNLVYRLGRLHSRAKKNYTHRFDDTQQSADAHNIILVSARGQGCIDGYRGHQSPS